MKHETFESALAACMATLAKFARANSTMHELRGGTRGVVNAWATEYLHDDTPIYVNLSIQRGDHEPGDRVAGYTLEMDTPNIPDGPDVFPPPRRQRSLPRKTR